MIRPPAAIEICRRCSSCEALDPGPDRHCNHVLLEALIIADAGIRPGAEQVDEAILGSDLKTDLWESLQERDDDSWKYSASNVRWNVEPKCTCRPITECIDRINRRFNLAKSWGEPIEEARARFSWCDAARRSIEKPNAQSIFEPSYGLAQRRGRSWMTTCGFTKSADADNPRKG